MAMPEATMDENDRAVLWENNVGFAGISLIVFAIAQSLGKQVFADDILWFGVFAPNMGHIITTDFRRMIVCHFADSSFWYPLTKPSTKQIRLDLVAFCCVKAAIIKKCLKYRSGYALILQG
jgi:hypothetical protein